jgi:hypothetical protein
MTINASTVVKRKASDATLTTQTRTATSISAYGPARSTITGNPLALPCMSILFPHLLGTDKQHSQNGCHLLLTYLCRRIGDLLALRAHREPCEYG